MAELEKDDIRERIVDDLESSLKPRKYGELLLAVSLILGTFGSAAVLMPQENSLTGQFAGDFQMQSPTIVSTKTSFVQDKKDSIEVYLDLKADNPNIVEAELVSIGYRVYAGSEVVKTGSINGSTVISARSSEIITAGVKLDKNKLISQKESFTENTDDMKIEGVMRFKAGGEQFDKFFSQSFSIS